MSVILQVEQKEFWSNREIMFYGRYDYPTGKFLWGNLRYQRVSEYNLQTFLNMKNRVFQISSGTADKGRPDNCWYWEWKLSSIAEYKIMKTGGKSKMHLCGRFSACFIMLA